MSTPGLRGRRALVTGASGFIGSHLLALLRDEGAEVHAVSRVRRPPDESLTWHEADLGDREATDRLVAAVAPEVVFHLAGDSRAARGHDLVAETFRANVASTVNLLGAVAAQGGARVVHAGSIEEPGPGDPPSSPYAASKAAARSYGDLYATVWALPVVTLRVFMTYGPGQRDLRKLVPYTILSLLRGEAPQLTSGWREIDWVYVEDVAAAFVAAATCADPAAASVDVGSGATCSIRSVVERLVALVDPTIVPVFGALEDRPLEQVRAADVESAAAALGWRPRVGLDEGLERTVEWYRAELARGTIAS